MILGMTFLRNAYLLINYGDYAKTKTPPYAQLLSTTDPTVAHLDFVSTRLGGTDTTGVQRFDTSTSSSNTDDVTSTSDRQRELTVIVGVVAGSILLLAAAIGGYLTVRHRRSRRLLHPGPDFSAVDTGYATYYPLHHAAPQGETHLVQGYQVELTTSDLRTEATPTAVERPTRGTPIGDLHTAPVGEVDYNLLPPRHEEPDPRVVH